MQLVIVAEDNWVWYHTLEQFALRPTDLSTAAVANYKPTLNTTWLVVHGPYTYQP